MHSARHENFLCSCPCHTTILMESVVEFDRYVKNKKQNFPKDIVYIE